MSDPTNCIDGNNFMTSSPFRSGYFLFATALGLASAVVDIYLIYRHWHTAPGYVVPILAIPIGLQLLYQWWRILRYRSKIRILCLTGQGDDKRALDIGTRIAVGGMIDLSFYSNGIAFFALILIGCLLTRLDGLR